MMQSVRYDLLRDIWFPQLCLFMWLVNERCSIKYLFMLHCIPKDVATNYCALKGEMKSTRARLQKVQLLHQVIPMRLMIEVTEGVAESDAEHLSPPSTAPYPAAWPPRPRSTKSTPHFKISRSNLCHIICHRLHYLREIALRPYISTHNDRSPRLVMSG